MLNGEGGSKLNNWIKRGSEDSVQKVFLRNIGVEKLDDVNDWFRESYSDAYYIDKLDDAVKMATDFINMPVRIIGDYDVDGVTSTSILLESLKAYGFTDVSYRIPKRFSEGFGINDIIIDEIESGLIITCDNGIAQLDAIKKAKDKGLTVIIIDHHEPVRESGKAVLPCADIIIDPNAIEHSARFNGYCGAGLSFKFAKKLLGSKHPLIAKLLGLAALGTVADVMELVEENYVFVRNGIKCLLNPHTTTQGLYALISSLDLSRNLDAHDIGFKIGPCLNSCSRMIDDGAKIAVNLLTFDGSYASAISEAEKVVELNKKRKELKESGLIKADTIIKDYCLMGDIPLVLKLDGVPEGIIGIIAGNLCEDYKVPAVVLTDIGDGILRGSSRSCGNYNMKEKLDEVSDLLVKYGGHAGAAGLSIKADKFDEFVTRLHDNASDFTNSEDKSCELYDLEINASEIVSTIQELKKYEPFGQGNAPIVFKVNNFSVNPKNGNFINKVTSSYDITKLFYKKDVVAIGFDMSSRFKTVPKKVTLYGTLSDNYFNGVITHQIEFSDFRCEEINSKIETPLAARLKSMALATTT